MLFEANARARCPKSKHSGRDHLDAAVAGAVVAFNDGSSQTGKFAVCVPFLRRAL